MERTKRAPWKGKQSPSKKSKKRANKREKTAKAPKKVKKSFKAQIQEAYNIGYKTGWSDREKLPAVRGAVTSAKIGYNDGMRDNARSKKYQGKLAK